MLISKCVPSVLATDSECHVLVFGDAACQLDLHLVGVDIPLHLQPVIQQLPAIRHAGHLQRVLRRASGLRRREL